MAKEQTKNEELVAMLAQAIRESNNSNQKQMTQEDINNASLVEIQMKQRIEEKAKRQMEYANRISYEMSQNINTSVVTVPKIYAEYQPSFTIAINGCTVNIKSNGKPRKLHNDFAVILLKRMKALDDKIAKMNEFDNREISR